MAAYWPYLGMVLIVVALFFIERARPVRHELWHQDRLPSGR